MNCTVLFIFSMLTYAQFDKDCVVGIFDIEKRLGNKDGLIYLYNRNGTLRQTINVSQLKENAMNSFTVSHIAFVTENQDGPFIGRRRIPTRKVKQVYLQAGVTHPFADGTALNQEKLIFDARGNNVYTAIGNFDTCGTLVDWALNPCKPANIFYSTPEQQCRF